MVTLHTFLIKIHKSNKFAFNFETVNKTVFGKPQNWSCMIEAKHPKNTNKVEVQNEERLWRQRNHLKESKLSNYVLIVS